MRHEDTKRKYQGVFIAAPTPMHDDESVDLPRLRDLIRRYVDAGMTDGNAVCTILGAGGEAMCLDEMERRKVAETAVEVADGKIPIFIGVGHTRTRTAVDLARHADQIGADGLQLELPYYFAATPGDAFAYISEVAKAVECGIALYPTPWTSNFEFDGPFVERVCAALPNVVGLKWSTKNVSEWFRVAERFHERLSIVSNMPSCLAPSGFLAGARGYVSQGASAAPRQNVQIVEWLQTRSYEKAMTWLRVVEGGYYSILADARNGDHNGEGNFIKASLEAVGFPWGPARLPNRPMPPSIQNQFNAWAQRIAELQLQEVTAR